MASRTSLWFLLAITTLGYSQSAPPFDFIAKFHGKKVTQTDHTGVTIEEFKEIKKTWVRWAFTAQPKKVYASMEAELKRRGWRKRVGPMTFYFKGSHFAYFLDDRRLFKDTKRNVTCIFEHCSDLANK